MLPRRIESEYGVNFSAGFSFETVDLEILEKILEKMSAEVDDEWEVKECHDDGSIFLKLLTNNTQSEFKFESNVPIKPLKLHHDKLEQHMDATVELVVAGWYRNTPEKKQYGLTLKVKKITWGNEKRKRKHDDEVNLNLDYTSYLFITVHTDVYQIDIDCVLEEEVPKKRKNHNATDVKVLKSMNE